MSISTGALEDIHFQGYLLHLRGGCLEVHACFGRESVLVLVLVVVFYNNYYIHLVLN